MKILVVGRTGFVGKNVTEFFEKKNEYEVINVGSKDLNLLDETSVRKFFANNSFDIVINAAVYNPRVSGSADKEAEYDLRMFHNIAMCNDSYGKMIYFGSGAEYDKRYPICSVKEEDLYNSDQSRCSGLVPSTSYGFAKYKIGRDIDKDLYGKGNIYNLRIFGLYGKYEYWKTTFISGACCKAMKNIPITIRKDVYFDYLYIDDFLKMLEGFINLDTPKYKTYNFTSGRRIRLTELAEIVNKVSDRNVPVIVCNEGLANEYTASNERIISELSFYEFESYEESINKLYNWYVSIDDQIDVESLLYQ